MTQFSWGNFHDLWPGIDFYASAERRFAEIDLETILMHAEMGLGGLPVMSVDLYTAISCSEHENWFSFPNSNPEPNVTF